MPRTLCNRRWLVAVAAVLAATGEASDHDDGDNDIKARALNLSDHFAFKSPPNQLSLVMYLNPRSLPGKAYFLGTNARYEFHVSKVANRTDTPTLKHDWVFRFEAQAPDERGVQKITLTVLKNGEVAGTVAGDSTDFAASKANTNVTVNTGNAGVDVRFFVGMRADSFYFDVNRFFEVRSFLARRFFGGPSGEGLPIDPDPTNTNPAVSRLAPNCEGDRFLQGLVATDGDGDDINLFNPPSCAPDFTKNLNVTAIVLDVPIAQLEGTVFDTWSTISVKR